MISSLILLHVTTLYSKCDPACAMWQGLELASEFARHSGLA